MLREETISKMKEMKLTTFADAFKAQCLDSEMESLSFEERVGMLIDAEWTARKNNRFKKLVCVATLSDTRACIENVEYLPDRNLDKVKLLKFASCDYIAEKRNLLIMAATGGGKTYLACAFGMAACRNYFTVKYIRLPDLLADLSIAKANGTYKSLLKKFKKVDLLILDDWLIYPLKSADANNVLEIVEGRYKQGSTIFCSQVDVGGWHQSLGDSVVADAICDRIAHESYRIVIGGKDSMRKRKGLKQEG